MCALFTASVCFSTRLTVFHSVTRYDGVYCFWTLVLIKTIFRFTSAFTVAAFLCVGCVCWTLCCITAVSSEPGLICLVPILTYTCSPNNPVLFPILCWCSLYRWSHTVCRWGVSCVLKPCRRLRPVTWWKMMTFSPRYLSKAATSACVHLEGASLSGRMKRAKHRLLSLLFAAYRRQYLIIGDVS